MDLYKLPYPNDKAQIFTLERAMQQNIFLLKTSVNIAHWLLLCVSGSLL